MKMDDAFFSRAHAGGSAGERLRFTLEKGELAGRSFTAALHICPNPVCDCSEIGFECHPLPTPDAATPGPPDTLAPLRFDMDVFKGALASQPDANALVAAVVGEIQTADCKRLADFYIAAKRRQMETMDLDTLEVELPSDIHAGDNKMLSYREIFPWAEALDFSCAGEEWFADDQYCIQPGCTCTETGLTFFRLPAAGPAPAPPLRISMLLLHDYVSGKTRTKEARPGSPAAGDLMEALRAARPDLPQVLRLRHGQLQQLGRRLLSGMRPDSKGPVPRRPISYLQLKAPGKGETPNPACADPSPPRSARVGRNDPCPCGSGKKFKKCCGAAGNT